MKKLYLTLAALLITVPVFAADQPADTPTLNLEAPAVETPALDCSEVEATPQGQLDELLKPEATPQATGCCQGARQACEANCRATGVFEFNCDPDTCTSSCICNIG